MKLSIRMKIFLPIMMILIVFPLAVWGVVRYSLDRHMNYNARWDLEQMVEKTEELLADTAGKELEEDGNGSLVNKLRDVAQTGTGETRMMVLSGRYRVVYPRNYDDQPEMSQIYSVFLAMATGGESGWVQGDVLEETVEGKRYLIYYRYVYDEEEDEGQRVRHVLLYCPVQDTTSIVNQVSRLVLLTMGAIAVVTIVLFWFVAGSISGPVRRLCEAARGIGEKKFQKVETGATVRELCELEDEINKMQENLFRADQAERTFFQNASHELRTPLMSISGYAQGIQCGVFEDVSQAAGVILDESTRLTEVVDGVLTLTRMDQSRYQLVPVELNINHFVEERLERLEGFAYSKNIKLVFSPGEEHTIITDAMLLERAFSNVMSNCIRYAKEQVTVTVREWKGQIFMKIMDDGPGLKKEELEHLFDRFYKGQGGNHGLGLAIARCSLEYMGGGVKAVSSSDGAIFEIALPQDCRSFAPEEWKEMW